jgi:hypothetical protein
VRLAGDVAGAYIEERSFDCVPRRAHTARKRKARDFAQDDVDSPRETKGAGRCAAFLRQGRQDDGVEAHPRAFGEWRHDAK